MPAHPTTRRVLTALAAIAIITGISGCSFVDEALSEVETSGSAAPSPTINTGVDYVEKTGTAERDYETTPGQVDYCDLDEPGRAICAYGELTPELRDKAQREGRKDITVDPAGWPDHNAEVDIPALDAVEGSKNYHGWMFNRSHLIADSLGGSVDVENLVTGTRMQNVGSHQKSGQYAGGMAHTELLARDFLDSADAKDCPLYYAATPNYSGDELIPRTVTVDVQSCDKSIDTRVEVSNTANGFEIDYHTGEYTPTN